MVMCVDLEHLDLTRLDVAPKEVPFNMKVLGARGEALVNCKYEGSIVVFENGAVNTSGEGPRNGKN